MNEPLSILHISPLFFGTERKRFLPEDSLSNSLQNTAVLLF